VMAACRRLTPVLYRYGAPSTIDRTAIRSAQQPFDRLFLIEPRKQLLGCQPRHRMAPARSYLGQRHEHESTFVEPWVRQDERSGLDHQTAMIEEIEVEHACGVSLAANSAELSLYRLQHGEQVRRGKIRAQRSDRVDEPRLVRARHRLGSIPGRAGGDRDTV